MTIPLLRPLLFLCTAISVLVLASDLLALTLSAFLSFDNEQEKSAYYRPALTTLAIVGSLALLPHYARKIRH